MVGEFYCEKEKRAQCKYAANFTFRFVGGSIRIPFDADGAIHIVLPIK